MTQSNNFPQIYQFRVVLRELSPRIWRRTQISSDCTIVDLHQTIQGAFNWADRHSCRFNIRDLVFMRIPKMVISDSNLSVMAVPGSQ